MNIIPSMVALSFGLVLSPISISVTLLLAWVCDILYPLIFFRTHCSQKWTNTHHFSGPPTDPCLTPLPCRKGSVFLPWASPTDVVAPPPSEVSPLSRLTSSCVTSSGIPRQSQLIAWLQYSIVSNALERSAISRCSSCPVALASSITSARILRGALTPVPGRPPYWARSSSPPFWMSSVILPITILSNILVMFSMRAMGLTLFRSSSPASVFGRRHIVAVLMQFGIVFSSRHLLNSFLNPSSPVVPSIWNALFPILEGPDADAPGLLLIPFCRSSIVISSLMPLNRPSASTLALFSSLGSW